MRRVRDERGGGRAAGAREGREVRVTILKCENFDKTSLQNSLFRILGKILFSHCTKCRILFRANRGAGKLRRIFSLLVEKSGAGRGKGLAEREREICGAFSPSRRKNIADHAFLHIAVKNRAFLAFSRLLVRLRRYATHPLPLAHFEDYGGRGRLFAGFSFLSAHLARRRHIEGVICSLSPHSACHRPSLLSALEIPSAHVYNVFMKSH